MFLVMNRDVKFGWSYWKGRGYQTSFLIFLSILWKLLPKTGRYDVLFAEADGYKRLLLADTGRCKVVVCRNWGICKVVVCHSWGI